MNVPLVPLESARLRECIADAGIAVDVLGETDSTNAWLLRLAPATAHRRAVFAEAQTAGRGRLGRSWRARAGRHLLLTIGWRFDAMPPPGLSLAAGVAVRRAIEASGVADATLKWPNDVFWHGRKLAGILIETRVAGDGVLAAIGAGINVALDDDEYREIDAAAVDLRAALGRLPDRNAVGAQIVRALDSCCEAFATSGFDVFRDEWNRHDANAGYRVRVMDGTGDCEGLALGVTADGALRLRVAGGQEQIFHAGDVSLRAL
jgi:BirA family biotin operon repressor/biotin-[acetyl-CoA-carboxylase] ligase